MKQLITLITLVLALTVGCNPFSFDMFGEVKKVKIEIIGKGLLEMYEVTIPVKNYEMYKEWFEDMQYVEYFPDGTPHVYYKAYFYNLSIKKTSNGIHLLGHGYSVRTGSIFEMDKVYDYSYNVDKSYSNVIVNVSDVK